MPQMYNSSHDMIALVDEVGIKLRNVVPDYQKTVKGSLFSDDLPQAKQAKVWIGTFLKVHRRFHGRDEQSGNANRPPKNKPDYRHSGEELRDIGELAQWLINLDAITFAKKTGQHVAPKQLTIREEDMIRKQRITA